MNLRTISLICVLSGVASASAFAGEALVLPRSDDATTKDASKFEGKGGEVKKIEGQTDASGDAAKLTNAASVNHFGTTQDAKSTESSKALTAVTKVFSATNADDTTSSVQSESISEENFARQYESLAPNSAGVGEIRDIISSAPKGRLIAWVKGQKCLQMAKSSLSFEAAKNNMRMVLEMARVGTEKLGDLHTNAKAFLADKKLQIQEKIQDVLAFAVLKGSKFLDLFISHEANESDEVALASALDRCQAFAEGAASPCDEGGRAWVVGCQRLRAKGLATVAGAAGAL